MARAVSVAWAKPGAAPGVAGEELGAAIMGNLQGVLLEREIMELSCCREF